MLGTFPENGSTYWDFESFLDNSRFYHPHNPINSYVLIIVTSSLDLAMMMR
jgi:hypothetical protein